VAAHAGCLRRKDKNSAINRGSCRTLKVIRLRLDFESLSADIARRCRGSVRTKLSAVHYRTDKKALLNRA
jgi:hypothetical protein